MTSSEMERSLLVKVVAQHGMWKYRLHDAIERGTSEFQPDQVAVDDKCALGQWLYGPETQRLRGTPGYERVRTLHADFHRSASEVLGAALAGDSEAASLLTSGSPFLVTSSSLVDALLRWGDADVEAPEELVHPDADDGGAAGSAESPRSTSSVVLLPLALVTVVVALVTGGLLAAAVVVAATVTSAAWAHRLDARRREQERADARRIEDAAVARIGRLAADAAAVAEEVRGLGPLALELSGTSEETGAQAEVATDAAGQVGQSIDALAAAAEELSASIREISAAANTAAGNAQASAARVSEMEAAAEQLDGSTQAISAVLDLITAIAGQTNLLALNATIEAARAGEAGKGFAVVASEVKDLASQTAEAVRQVDERISAIREGSGAVVNGVQEIAGVVAGITDSLSSIAGAVEEQNVATAEISRNVNEAAAATGEIVANVAAVRLAATGNRAGMTRFRTSIGTIAARLTSSGRTG